MNQFISIGIITTPEAKKMFEEIVEEFGNVKGEVVIYQDDDEIQSILNASQKQWDIVLFGGLLSYYKGRKYVSDNIPTLCVDFKASELMKGLLEIAKEGQSLNKIGLDTFEHKLVNEVFEELQLEQQHIYLKEFDPNEPIDGIISFHQKLWDEKKINYVITCRRRVYIDLKRRNIPVKVILPTPFNVRESMHKAVLLGENSKNINAQSAVGIYTLIPKVDSDIKSDYELDKINLEFHRYLVDIAQLLDASLIPTGTFRFMLYTSRGLLEKSNQVWMEHKIIHKIEKELSSIVIAGFGIGRTPMSAQLKAKRALQLAREKKSSCGFLIREDGKIIGPLGKNNVLEYQYKSNEPMINKIAKNTHLSIDSVTKIHYFSQSHRQFTAEELSHTLDVTTRNARNIIKKLNEANYVQKIGEERPYSKGRPRQIYSFNLTLKDN